MKPLPGNPPVGALLLALASVSPQPRYFHYQRPLGNLPDRASQACLAIDAEIFAHAAPQLADLRLFRDGEETPYVVRSDTSVAASQSRIEPLNLGRQNGHTVFDAEIPDPPFNDLELDIAARDFLATVTVTGSQTLRMDAPTKLGSYTFFDLSRQRLGRSTILHLPQSNFRYLHFRISGAIAPESISGLSVTRLPDIPPSYRVVAETAQADRKGRQTLVHFRLPANVPVDRIVFDPGDTPPFFSRDVTVQVRSIPVAPIPVATSQATPGPPIVVSGNILRLHTFHNGQRIDEERLTVATPVGEFPTDTQWTISIDNEDDAPVVLRGIRLEMLERSLCFQSVANAGDKPRYTLYYGDAALNAPRYDYAALFAPEADAARVTAAPEQPNPGYTPRPDERPFTEKHPALLWAALLAVVALLGFLALRSSGR